MHDGRMNRGEQFMQQQLAEMEASGLGGQAAVAPAQAHLDWMKAGRGPQWREWWRVAVGAVLLVGGIGLWLTGHLLTIPPLTLGRYGVPVLDGPHQRAISEHTALEVLGVFTAVAGVVWLLNQVWLRRRTYSSREVTRAGVIGALLVAGVALWFFANRSEGVLSGSNLPGLLVLMLQTEFITRMTGPDSVRRPAHDPRGDIYRLLTPWPVVLGCRSCSPPTRSPT